MYLEMLQQRYGSALEKQAAAIGSLVAKAVKPRTFGGFFGKMVGSNPTRIAQRVNKLRIPDGTGGLQHLNYADDAHHYMSHLVDFGRKGTPHILRENRYLAQAGIRNMRDQIRNAVPDLSKRYLP